MDRVIGASPFIGGLLGSTVLGGGGGAWVSCGKNAFRGNSKVRGEKRLGVGGASSSGVAKLLEKDCSGLFVISEIRGDISSSYSSPIAGRENSEMVARGGSGFCNLGNENAARGGCWKTGRTRSSILDIGGSGARRCGGGKTLAAGAGGLFSRCCCGELIDI